MAAEAQIKAVITADDRASATLNKFGDKVGGVGQMGTLAAAGIAAAGAAAVAFGVASVNAFNESELAIAQTNAVLQSTAGIAGVTAAQVGSLASELEKSTRFSDEQVRSAENMLLTFTNISSKIFPDTTKAVADMATAMGTDLKSTSIQVGKALQDPVNGVTALQRVGVRLTEGQKDLVKSLVASGDTMGAQKVILQELQKEFGGSAVAAGNTFAGSIDKAKNSFNNLMEGVGGGIANILAPALNSMVTLMQQWSDGTNPRIEAFKQSMTSIWNIFVAFSNYIVTTFSPTLQTIGQFFMEWIVPALKTVWQEIQTKLMPALRELWTNLSPILTPALKILAAVIGGTLIVAILAIIGMLRAFVAIVTWVSQAINSWVDNTRNAGAAIYNIFNSIVNAVRGAINTVVAVMRGLPGSISSAVGGLGGLLYNAGRDLIQGLINGVRSMAGAVWQSIKDVTKDVINTAKNMLGIKSPSVVFMGIGENIGKGMAQGIEASAGLVQGSMVDMASPTQAQAAAPMTTSNSNSTINITISSMYSAGSEVEKRKFAKDILGALQDVANQKNTTVSNLMGA